MDKREAIEALRREATAALAPQLTPDQTQVVFGDGDPASPLVLVGEAPGPQEDKLGRPFVGKSGQLLEKTLVSLGLDRSRIWISNTVKVWPTTRTGRSLKTRPPSPAEKLASRPFFDRELDLIQPQAILCLGATAATALIGKGFQITRERGQWRTGPHGFPVMATFHPSYILRLQGMNPPAGERALADFTDDLRHAAQRAGLLDQG